MFYDRPGGLCHPRETLVPSRVQLIVTFTVAVTIATPVLKWFTAWAIQCCTKTDGTKAVSKSFEVDGLQSGFLAHRLWPNSKQNIVSLQKDAARAECSNTPVPTCAQQP